MPTYVYDLNRVRQAYATLRSALPPASRLFYSLKANPHPAIVRALSQLGCDVELCSAGELAAAAAGGAPLHQALYTGPGKRDAEVVEAVKAGVRWFSVDSPAGIDQVHRAAEAQGVLAHCLLRVNGASPVPGQGLTMTGVASPFGADVEWILAAPHDFGGRPAAEVAGLHLYLGTNLTRLDDLIGQFRDAVETAVRVCAALRLRPRLLDLGGGFGAPYARRGELPDLTGLSDTLAELLDTAFSGWRDGDPGISFESGRFLSGPCGTLLTRVADVKYSHGRPVVILESGINHLGGMAGLRRLPPLVPDIAPAEPEAALPGLTDAIVAGPLCTPLDTWARSADLPTVQKGQIVCVPNVGAYGLSASLLGFLGHPAPHEVVVDGGRVVEVSQLALVRHTALLSTEEGRTRWMPNSSAL